MAESTNKYYYNQTTGDQIAETKKWWDLDEDSAYVHINALVKKHREQASWRTENNLKFYRLYSNMDITAMRPGFFQGAPSLLDYSKNRVTLNVIKSCIDTAAAKIAKNKPRPVFLTEEGSWYDQQKAKKMSNFMLAMFKEMGTGQDVDRSLYGVGRQAFVDAATSGTGVVKFWPCEESRSVKCERIINDEIILDENEGIYRKPRQIHQAHYIDRLVLADMYPKKADKILSASSAVYGTANYNQFSDLVEVVESWHLRSGTNQKDGRHAISIDNCTLKMDDYDKNYFPFLFLRWSLRPLGFWGMGLAEELIGIQLEINKLLRTIQLSQHLMAVPQVWLEYENRVIAKQLTNEIGGIRYYRGRPPTFVTPQAMAAEVYRHLDRLYERAYEITGISLLSATSRKPAGLDAAVALREYQDIESERFSLITQDYENFYMEATGVIKDMCRDLVDKNLDPVVKLRDGFSMQKVYFSDIDLPDDKTTVIASPTNILPSEPSGKLQKVQELTQAGFYDKEEARALLDFPDLQKVNGIKNAPFDVIIKMIEKIIEKGEEAYETPEPFLQLDYARTQAQLYYARGRADGMPEERLDLLRRFMDDCQALIEERDAEIMRKQQEAQVAAMQAQAQPPAGTQATPEPQPMSDLLPQAV